MNAFRRVVLRFTKGLVWFFRAILWSVLSLPFGIGFIALFFAAIFVYVFIVVEVAEALSLPYELVFWASTAGIIGFGLGHASRPAIDRFIENRRLRQDAVWREEAAASMEKYRHVQESASNTAANGDTKDVAESEPVISDETETDGVSVHQERTTYQHSWPFPDPHGSSEFHNPSPSRRSKTLRSEFAAALPADLTVDEMHEHWHAYLEDHLDVWRSCHGALVDRVEEASFFAELHAERHHDGTDPGG